MKATGVIRRIDELGRIVIPKELRKNMHIKNGENLEIYIADDEKIVLKKYSCLKNISDLANYITEAISKELKLTCIIFDNEDVIACSGKDKKEYMHIQLESLDNDFISQNIFLGGDIVGTIALKTTDQIYKKILNTFALFLEKYLD